MSMGATRQELLDLADFWEERGDLKEADRLRVSAGEVKMYALFAESTGGYGYSSPWMIGEPSEDWEALEQEYKRRKDEDNARHSYGTGYRVCRVEQQTVWVRTR